MASSVIYPCFDERAGFHMIYSCCCLVVIWGGTWPQASFMFLWQCSLGKRWKWCKYWNILEVGSVSIIRPSSRPYNALLLCDDRHRASLLLSLAARRRKASNIHMPQVSLLWLHHCFSCETVHLCIKFNISLEISWFAGYPSTLYGHNEDICCILKIKLNYKSSLKG